MCFSLSAFFDKIKNHSRAHVVLATKYYHYATYCDNEKKIPALSLQAYLAKKLTVGLDLVVESCCQIVEACQERSPNFEQSILERYTSFGPQGAARNLKSPV